MQELCNVLGLLLLNVVVFHSTYAFANLLQ